MSDAQHSRTHLFMVRVWLEDLGEGKTEWRGKIQHVLSGDVCYFRDWQIMEKFIKAHSRCRAVDTHTPEQEEI